MALSNIARRQHGVVSLEQLRELGLNQRGVSHRVARGRLHRIHRGVYAAGPARLSRYGVWMAAVLACGPHAVLSHRSAGAAWELRANNRAAIEITTTDRGRAGPPRVEIHRVRLLTPQDITRVHGIPVTSVARTLLDLADVLNTQRLARIVHRAEALDLFDLRAVEAVLERATGRRGVARLRAAVPTPDPGPTVNDFEEHFLELCERGGLPTPRMNADLILSDGRHVKPDAYWADARLVVELDSASFHHTRHAFEDDRRRDAALAAEGYLTVRFTWRRLTHEADDLLDELRRVRWARLSGIVRGV